MTPFEKLVERLDTLIIERVGTCMIGKLSPNMDAVAAKRVADAKKPLIAAIKAIHGPVDMRPVSRERREAVFCHRPTDPGLSPPDPDRWAKAALKAAAFDAKFIGVNWDNISVAGQDHWRLVADAVRNVKP